MLKLKLTEDEREVMQDLCYNSDAHKVLVKVLDQLSAMQEANVLSLYQDGSDSAKNRLVIAAAELQGARKLAKSFREIKNLLKLKD